MAGNLPFLFLPKKLACMLIAAVQVIGYILLAIFSKSMHDKLIENSGAYEYEIDSLRAKYMTALLIFTIAAAVFHFAAVLGIFFEHLYITAVVAVLEIGTVVGALLEAIMIHNIFWFAFGVALLSMALLALHLFDLLSVYNFQPEYKAPSARPPTADAEDSE